MKDRNFGSKIKQTTVTSAYTPVAAGCNELILIYSRIHNHKELYISLHMNDADGYHL